MIELNNKTLAQIVSADHRAASVFEKYNLDFCCNGKRSLQQACDEIQLPVDRIAGELSSVTSSCKTPVEFDKMSLTQLADYIVFTHHSYVKNEMPLVFGYLQKVASKHGDRHPEMRDVFEVFSAVKEEMEKHMQKEEFILFPRIKSLETEMAGKSGLNNKMAYLQLPIHLMEEEHEHAGRLLEEIRQLTDNYAPPEDACTTYRLSLAALQAFELDLHQHVHLENNILFPKPLQLFNTLDEAALKN